MTRGDALQLVRKELERTAALLLAVAERLSERMLDAQLEGRQSVWWCDNPAVEMRIGMSSC